MAEIDDVLNGGPHHDPEEQRRRLVIVAMKRVIEARFDASDWTELGLLTGSSEVLDRHPRLYRSLSFGDDDYGACILEVLPNVLGNNFEYEQDVASFIDMEPWLREHDPRLHAAALRSVSLHHRTGPIRDRRPRRDRGSSPSHSSLGSE